MTIFERYVTEAAGVITLVDQFAKERGTRGEMPSPIPPLRFSLIAHGLAMTPLDPPISLAAQRSGSGTVYVFADEARDRRGEPSLRIAPDRYRLRIEGDYYQPLELDLEWPPTPATLLPQPLLPGYNYPFPDVTLPSSRMTLLRGTVVRGVRGDPVPNATVTVANTPAGFTTARTDKSGAWVVAFRHANANDINATVTIAIPGEPDVVVNAVVLKAGQDNALSQTSLRGAVFTTRNTPVRDAEISVDIIPNQSVRTGGEGLWMFYFDINQPDGVPAEVTAVAPNGDTASENVPQVKSRATVVVPTFHIG
ncbi:MAG: hypothetical protein DMF56_14690 [Acidobacteria bacterium]|nr:MAG: hypothetical protein DMF56_14690 [Acidobacteriota bacterium]